MVRMYVCIYGGGTARAMPVHCVRRGGSSGVKLCDASRRRTLAVDARRMLSPHRTLAREVSSCVMNVSQRLSD